MFRSTRSKKRDRFVLAEFLLHSYRVIHRITGCATINSQPHTHLLRNPGPAKVDRLKRLQAATAVELDALLSAIPDKALKGER